MATKTVLAGLQPVDFQSISLADSTAIALNSTIQASASVLDISVETNAVRYRADGTDPTLTTGVLLPTGVLHRLEGYNRTSVLKFQRTTGTSLVQIMAYKQLG